MTEDEAAAFRNFTREEITLYEALFGIGAFPSWMKPAKPEWADGTKLERPFIRYPKFHDPRPKFDVPGVGLVTGYRRLAEVRTKENAARINPVWKKQQKRTRLKRLRASAA